MSASRFLNVHQNKRGRTTPKRSFLKRMSQVMRALYAGGTMIFFQVPPETHVLPILVGDNVFLHRLLENGQESIETD